MPLSQRDYYLQGRDSGIIDAYRKFVAKVATSFGADTSQTASDFEDLIDFEINLANVSVVTLRMLK